jgi:hypothetical protein
MILAVNLPGPMAEMQAAFAAYEAALVGNDVTVLDLLFWNSPHTLRYGVTENLHGYDAIAAFRAARSPAGLARRLSNTVITTFGEAFATANTEFHREGASRTGRQSQTWVKFPTSEVGEAHCGWRIVAAHVSLLAPPG